VRDDVDLAGFVRELTHAAADTFRELLYGIAPGRVAEVVYAIPSSHRFTSDGPQRIASARKSMQQHEWRLSSHIEKVSTAPRAGDIVVLHLLSFRAEAGD
jgi:hypothetical protein